jgi:hypothetical protein
VVDGAGVDSMLQFWLERGGDGMKHCRKMKQRRRAHLGSMGGSVTRCSSMVTSAIGVAVLVRGKGRDDASWVDTNPYWTKK